MGCGSVDAFGFGCVKAGLELVGNSVHGVDGVAKPVGIDEDAYLGHVEGKNTVGSNDGFDIGLEGGQVGVSIDFGLKIGEVLDFGPDGSGEGGFLSGGQPFEAVNPG